MSISQETCGRYKIISDYCLSVITLLQSPKMLSYSVFTTPLGRFYLCYADNEAEAV